MATEYILVDYENTQPKADEVALVQRASQRLWIFRGPGQKKYEAEFVEALLALGDIAKVVRCEKSGANALDMHIAFELGRLAAGSTGGAGAAVEFTVVSKDTDYEPLLQYLRKLGFAARREKTLTAALPAGHGARAKSAKAATDSGKAEVAAKAGRAGAKAAPPRKAAARTAARPAEAAAAEPAAKQAKQARPARQPAKKAAKQPAARHAAAQPSHVSAMRASLEKQSARNRPTRLGSLRKWLENRQVPAAEVDAVIAALQASCDLQVDGTKLTYPNFA
jgi:hypothetical protein